MPIRIPITRPALGEEEVSATARVLRSGWVMQGPEVAAFEVEFAHAVGAAHAVAVTNGTVALELALRVVGVGAGDEVVTVSHSFIATANAVRAVGARPVFVDIEADTFGMDPRRLEAAITSKTRAIMPVHQVGIPCDILPIVEIAKRHEIPVVEDAACALGSEIYVDGEWQRLGRPHGALACFSFHPRKIVTTGDGGMITTSSEPLARRMRSLRNHAMSDEGFAEPGYNYRMTDLAAAVGRPQLARLDAIIAERRRLAAKYEDALSASGEHLVIDAPRLRSWARVNWQSYVVSLREGMEPQSVIGQLAKRGIASREGISNAHQERAYADRATWACGEEHGIVCERKCRNFECKALGISERIRARTVLVPLFHGMTDSEADQVIGALRDLKR